MPSPMTPEEFAKRAAETGLILSNEHASDMDVPGYSPAAAYEAIRVIDYSAEEPAVIFHPLKRGGQRS